MNQTEARLMRDIIDELGPQLAAIAEFLMTTSSAVRSLAALVAMLERRLTELTE